jgi:hypothetical protein
MSTIPPGPGPATHWTSESLREYILALLNAQDVRHAGLLHALDVRLTNSIAHTREAADSANRTSQLAIDKAEAAVRLRFESFNEFNERMNKVTADSLPRETFTEYKDQDTLTRQSVDARFAAMELKINAMTTANMTAKAVKDEGFARVVLIASAAAGLVSGLMTLVVAWYQRGG